MNISNFIKSTLVLILLTVSSVAFAQQRPIQKTPEERAQRQTEWMKQNLAITDDQNKQVYDIILKFAKQIDAVRTASTGDKRPQIISLNQNKEAAIKGILTADQYRKYDQHMKEMKEMMQQRKNARANTQGVQHQ